MGDAFPSLTKKWHSEAYDAIDPTRPELSAKGKIIVITGGGGSIGCATALAFAKAGATKIAVIGRRDGPLSETKKTVESEVPGSSVLTVQGDIADGESMKKALNTVREQLGKINILVANAGYLPQFEPVLTAEPEEWWRGFEINTKGAFNVARALLSGPVADDLIVVEVSTCVVHMPAMQSGSGYVCSKAAATKIWETVGRENSDKVSVAHVHPGVIYSELNVKSGITATDNANLPGSFIVWICSPEGAWLRGDGKYAWVNWDVPELLERKEELSAPDQLVITLQNWPFGKDSSGSNEALKF